MKKEQNRREIEAEKNMLQHAISGKFGEEVDLTDFVSKAAVEEFLFEQKEKLYQNDTLMIESKKKN